MIFEIPMEKYNKANSYNKRDCYKELEEYINNDSTNVCALYGLRRTGKSTMMFQAMKDIGLESIGYILCENADSYGDLCKKLDEYILDKKKVVFIDEITKLSDFITSSAGLADYYSGTGTKIVITGTDSLGLNLVTCGELHDRIESIHTTYISYGEFTRLINNSDIDYFIHYAGVLSHESNKKMEFLNRETASRYIDTAISDNITNTFFKDKLPVNFVHKYDKLIGLHNRNILVPTISAIVEMYSGLLTKDSIDSYFKDSYFNSDISSALQILGKHNIFIDRHNFSDDFEGQIVHAINSRRDVDDYIEPETVSQIIDYLYELELIVSIPEVRYNDEVHAIKRGREYYFSTSEYIYQAGMKYCQSKAIIEIVKDSNDILLSPKERGILIEKIDEDIKGQIIEITITNDLQHYLNKDVYEVLKMKFTGSKDGEIDIVVSNKKDNSYYGFEVKHATSITEEQAKNLIYKPFQKILGDNYGEQKLLSVLYRGETKTFPINGIYYINISDFLNMLYLSKTREMDEIIKDCLNKKTTVSQGDGIIEKKKTIL